MTDDDEPGVGQKTRDGLGRTQRHGDANVSRARIASGVDEDLLAVDALHRAAVHALTCSQNTNNRRQHTSKLDQA